MTLFILVCGIVVVVVLLTRWLSKGPFHNPWGDRDGEL